MEDHLHIPRQNGWRRRKVISEQRNGCHKKTKGNVTGIVKPRQLELPDSTVYGAKVWASLV